MNEQPSEEAEVEALAVAARYARRAALPPDRYSMRQADVLHAVQERQRKMLRLFKRHGWHNLGQRRVLEVGCGAGGNLLELLRLGFAPEHLAGVELLPERLAQARHRLPAATALWQADATTLALPPDSVDAVLVSTVFSSLLEDAVQQRLASALWRWVQPGGAVIWYDFVVNNPRNADVRGVPLARVRQLFPQGRLEHHRVTLAPPLARALGRVHPALLPLANGVPLLRTHVLAWITKPSN